MRVLLLMVSLGFLGQFDCAFADDGGSGHELRGTYSSVKSEADGGHELKDNAAREGIQTPPPEWTRS
jgi:hypothetical protein